MAIDPFADIGVPRSASPTRSRTVSAPRYDPFADIGTGQATAAEDASPTLLSSAGSVLHGVGDVVSLPFRGLGMLATGIQEELADTPPERSRLGIRPGASAWDRALGVDSTAPTPAQLAVEGYKLIPQALDGVADLTAPGAIRGDDEVTRRGFERGNIALARAEAVAEPVLEMGMMFGSDPALAGLGALGRAAQAGSRLAGGVGRGIGASFVPGMAEGAVEGGREFLRAGADEGYLSPAALRAGAGALTSGAMAALTGLHAAGIGGHGRTAERATEVDPLEATAETMRRARLERELAGEPLVAPARLDPEALRAAEDAQVASEIVDAGEGFDPIMEAQTRAAREAAALRMADTRLPSVREAEAREALGATREQEGIAAQDAERAVANEAQARRLALTQGIVPDTPSAAFDPAARRAAAGLPPLEKLTPEQKSTAPPESPLSPAAMPSPAPEPSTSARDVRGSGAERRVETGPVEMERRLADRRSQLATEHPDLPPKALDMIAEADVAREAAETDPITQLPTRAVFERKLKTHNGGVASLDVSGLKFINDNLGGHPTGDKFLRALGDAAKAEPGVEVARLGGDELGLLAESEAAADAASLSIQARFAKAKFAARLPDGTVVDYTGGRVDYGAGKYEAKTGPADFARADDRLYQKRQAAVASGERSPTPGSRPRGLVEVPAGGERVPGDAPAGAAAELTPAKPGIPSPAELSPPETKHAVATAEATPAKPIDHAAVKRAFPSAKITRTEEGFALDLGQGREVRVLSGGEIEYNAGAFKAGYGRNISGKERVVGSWQKLERGGIIQLAKEGATDATLLHESFHAAMDLALSQKQKRAVLREYGSEEKAADAYGAWNPKTPNGVFGQIRQFFRRLYRNFVPDAESVFQKVRSGEVYERAGKAESGPVREAYATAAAAVGDRVENFRRWFDGSKIVKQGRPRVVYHGTPRAGFTTFDPNRKGKGTDSGYYGEGFYFTERAKETSLYAGGREGAGVMPVYLAIKRPFIIDVTSDISAAASEAAAKRLGIELQAGGRVADPDGFASRLKRAGYDGVIFRDRGIKGEHRISDEYVAFEPTQVKSAIGNRGTFDPQNPDIRFATERLGDRPQSAKEARALADRTKDPEDIKHAAEREAIVARRRRHVDIAARVKEKYGNPNYPDWDTNVDQLKQLGVSKAEAIDFLAALRAGRVPGWIGAFIPPPLGEQGRAVVVPRLDRPGETMRAYRFRVSEVSAPKYATAPAEPPSVSKVRPIPEKPREVETVLGKEGRAAAIKAANETGGEVPSGKPPDQFINFDRVSTDDHVKAMQGRIVTSLEEQLGKAKGYRSWEEARVKALASGITEKDFVRMMRDKEGVSDHVIEAGRMMREESARTAADKIDAAQKLRREGADETKILEAEREADAAAALHAAVTWGTVRAGAEAGRALAIHRKLSEGLTPSERFFKKALKEVPLMTEAQRTALAKAVIKGDSAEIANITREAFRPSRMNQFLEYWKAGLVSGPPTLAGNVGSNSLMELWRTAERGGAGAADFAYSKLTGAPRQRYAMEAFKALTSLRTSVPRAGRILWDILSDPRSDFDMGSESRVEHAVPQIGGKTGTVVRTPFRVLKAFDEAAKHVARQNELFAQSYRMAKLSGAKDIDARMAEIVKSSGEYQDAARARTAGAKLTNEQRAVLADKRSQRLAEDMDRAAKNATFQEEAGKITQAALLLRGTNPAWQLIAPFVKTPSRILVAGFERTPLGFAKVWKGVKEGKYENRGELLDAVIKPTMGTLLGLSFVMMAEEGFITGSGPADPREQKLKLATGWQPHSIKIGDQYYSYKRMEPLATLLSLAGEYQEASQEDRGKLAEKLQQAFVENVTSKSYLQGVVNFGELIADPKRYGPTFLRNLEGSLVPNIAKKTAEAIDPTVRDTSGLAGPIVSRIPGATMTLPPRKSATGDEITRPGTAAERLASPFARSSEKDAPLERELLAVGYAPSAPERLLTVPHTQGKLKVELTQDEYRLMQDYDAKASERIRRAIKSPGYRALDPEERKRFVERVYRDAGSAARRDVMRRTGFRTRAQARMKELLA